MADTQNNTQSNATTKHDGGPGYSSHAPAGGANPYAQSDMAGPTATPLPEVPMQELEYSKGDPQPAKFSIDYPEATEQTVIEGNGPTTQLSDYPAANQVEYSTPPLGAEDQTTTNMPTTGVNAFNTRRKRTSKYAQPLMLWRGTNVLSPFGILYAVNYLIKQVTQFGVLGALQTAYSRATGSLKGQFSLREVNNFKAFAEMKDAIISYRSRSIDYTNLDTIDMMLLAAKREGALMEAALPLFAAKFVREYVQDLAACGLSYSPELFRNLTDPEVQQAEFRLYTALQNQPTFDPETWKRLGMFTKLHTSAARTGNIPSYIATDVTINMLGGYAPTGKRGAYTVGDVSTVRCYNYGPGTTHALFETTDSFIGWVHRYLGGKATRNVLIAAYDTALSIANDTIQAYKIITGAVNTIEANRGAKYSLIGEFLPVKGVHVTEGCSFLDFIIGRPVFTYYYKEKVEHAPKCTVGETSSGTNNALYIAKQDNIPNYGETITQVDYEALAYQRPVGLYKGDSAWTVEEMIFAGLYRHVESAAGIQAFTLNVLTPGESAEYSVGTRHVNYYNFSTTGSVSVTSLEVTFTAPKDGVANVTFSKTAVEDLPYGIFYDMVYGDMYMDRLGLVNNWNVGTSSPKAARGVYALSGGDYVILAGQMADQAENPGASWTPNPSPSWNNFSIASWTSDRVDYYTVAASEERYDIEGAFNFANALNYLYTNLDISVGPYLRHSSKAGNVDVPYEWWTPYRGAQWYSISLITAKSKIVTLVDAFSMHYRNNAQVRADRSGRQ